MKKLAENITWAVTWTDGEPMYKCAKLSPEGEFQEVYSTFDSSTDPRVCDYTAILNVWKELNDVQCKLIKDRIDRYLKAYGFVMIEYKDNNTAVVFENDNSKYSPGVFNFLSDIKRMEKENGEKYTADEIIDSIKDHFKDYIIESITEVDPKAYIKNTSATIFDGIIDKNGKMFVVEDTTADDMVKDGDIYFTDYHPLIIIDKEPTEAQYNTLRYVIGRHLDDTHYVKIRLSPTNIIIFEDYENACHHDTGEDYQGYEVHVAEDASGWYASSILDYLQDKFNDTYLEKLVSDKDTFLEGYNKDGFMLSKDKKTLLKAKENIVKANIPETVERIAAFAFMDRGDLSEINIPASVKEIGSYAFNRCYRLESIIIPDTVQVIEKGALSSCWGLLSIKLPKYLNSIPDEMFTMCEHLESIKLPANVEKIGDNAFRYCEHLENLELNNNIKSIGNEAFYGCDSLTIHTDNNYVKEYCDKNNVKCDFQSSAYLENLNEDKTILQKAYSVAANKEIEAKDFNIKEINKDTLDYYYNKHNKDGYIYLGHHPKYRLLMGITKDNIANMLLDGDFDIVYIESELPIARVIKIAPEDQYIESLTEARFMDGNPEDEPYQCYQVYKTEENYDLAMPSYLFLDKDNAIEFCKGHNYYCVERAYGYDINTRYEIVYKNDRDKYLENLDLNESKLVIETPITKKLVAIDAEYVDQDNLKDFYNRLNGNLYWNNRKYDDRYLLVDGWSYDEMIDKIDWNDKNISIVFIEGRPIGEPFSIVGRIEDGDTYLEKLQLDEKIVKLSDGKWQVQSEKGRNMGTYNTKGEAEDRLKEVEMFKHMNEDINHYEDLIDDVNNCDDYKEILDAFDKHPSTNLTNITYLLEKIRSAINSLVMIKRDNPDASLPEKELVQLKKIISTVNKSVNNYLKDQAYLSNKEITMLGLVSYIDREFKKHNLSSYNDKDFVVEELNEQLLLEKTRNQLIDKSKKSDNYSKKNQGKGRNRWERRVHSRIANTVRDYNKIDMDAFFKADILDFIIKVQGETNNYEVQITFEEALREIARQIKSNNNNLEFKCVLRGLISAFNRGNVYVSCSCPDWKYRQAYWSTKGQYNSGTPQPDNGKAIANPNDTKGAGCKHVNLCLANLDWMMKIASVINNYIYWARDNLEWQYAKFIFPQIFGMPYDRAIQMTIDMYDETGELKPEYQDDRLKSNEDIINMSNMIGKQRGQYKKKPEKSVNPRFADVHPKKEEPEEETNELGLELENEEPEFDIDNN